MSPAASQSGAQAGVRGDVAIIGMACTYPGARNLSAFWQNIVEGVDAITDVPPDRWNPDVYFDSDPASGKIYCKRGGYLGTSFTFNPLKMSTMPRAVEGAEPDQFFVLRAAHEALEDAGYLHCDLSGERAAFILGRGNYLGAGLTGLVQRGMITEQTLDVLRSLHPALSSSDLDLIRRELQSRLHKFGADNAPGLIPNITTGRVANRLDLMGPTYTVDAACASSLIATEQAVRGLLTGQFDVALAGGVHIFTDVSFLHVFCAMGALSQTSVIRPFDQNCDGTIPGEGVGILVLKRLSDAQRDSDRIYAVIKGVGTSSDGKAMSVTAPRVEGEELALRRAYEMSGIDPRTISLIEAHGTGTPIGDATEIEALTRVLGRKVGDHRDCALGSVKSMIGHTMPAAGAAALIKTALSLHHRTLPPTLHCEQPADSLRRDDCRFYINQSARPWITSQAAPRRAGVNAFGFGGINAHIVLEEYPEHASITSQSSRPNGDSISVELKPISHRHTWDAELFILEADSREALQKRAASLRDYVAALPQSSLTDIAFTLNTQLQGKAHRAAIVAGSATDLQAKLARLSEKLADAACTQVKDAQGIYYLHDSPVRGGKIAFLFPGLGGQHCNMLADLCIHFPLVRECFDNADHELSAVSGRPLSADLFPLQAFSEQQAAANETRLAAIERANPAVLTANGAIHLLLEKLGLKADMMTGHSSGEWVVLPAADMVTVDSFVKCMSGLSHLWKELSSDASVPAMAMLNLGTDRETVAAISAQLSLPIQVANDNCLHQVVVVVEPKNVDAVLAELRKRGIVAEKLPYAHGYHTPEFTHVTDSLRQLFSGLSIKLPGTKLYSCTNATAYPDNAADVVELLAHTFARPLVFRDTIEAMYRDGARIFIEAGPRGNLCSFVNDILRGRPHASIPVQQFRKSGLVSLQHALAQLAALHVPISLNYLYQDRDATLLTFDVIRDRGVAEADEPGAMQISLCPPRMSLPADIASKINLFAHAEPPAVKELRNPMPQNGHSEHHPRANVASGIAIESFVKPASNFEAPSLETNNGTARVVSPDAAAQLQVHFQLMDSFLQLNQEVMQTYFGGVTDQSPQTHSPSFEDDFFQFEDPAAENLLNGFDSGSQGQYLSAEELNSNAQATAAHPFVATSQILEHQPAQSVVIVRRIDVSEDIYLADHCFDPFISDENPDRERLCIVPLTVSLEMMAETAALLAPEWKVVGARNVQAAKWIEVEPGGELVTLEIRADRLSPTEVRVAIRHYDQASRVPLTASSPLAEGTFVLAAEYPAPTAPTEFALHESRAPMHTAEEMYSHRRMFHGPRFRGVASLDAVGTNGLRAQLEVLPDHESLRTCDAPRFIFDPFLLDAAGQLVGYWPVEYCDEGFVLFPIRIGELTLYRENLQPGQRAQCRLHIDEVAQRQLRATMDVLAPDGNLWMRIEGWQDWRFYWDQTFYDFWRFPNIGIVSDSLEIPGISPDDVECRRMAPFGEIGSSIWENLWAHLILNQRELEQYRSMKDGPRRTEWIFGRAAAKDAVRMWAHRRTGLQLFPADVEIQTTPDGKPVPAGAWLQSLDHVPQLSISHKDKTAVAIAASFPIGIDMEIVEPRDPGFEQLAFDQAEFDLLIDCTAAQRHEWITRFWCAKEAASKAIGSGLKNGLRSLRIVAANQKSGTIAVQCPPGADVGMEREFTVQTTRDGEFVLAVALEERAAHAR